MPPVPSKSRVVVESDGSRHGTHVYLLIEDAAGESIKMEIPHLMSLHYSIGEDREKRDGSLLILTLGGTELQSSVAIGPGRATIEDLLAEMAASGLLAKRDD